MIIKHNFTKSFILSLPPAKQGKRDYYKDNKVNSLEIMVTDKGSKSFKVTKKKDGRIIRVTLGKHPDLSIENARKKAHEVNAQIADGINPNEEKGKLNQEITFGVLFKEFIERYAKKQKKTWQDDERDINRLCSHWFKKRISTITNQDIRAFHEKLGNDAPYMANRMLAKIKVIYNKAIEWGYSGNNPANNIKKFKEESRDRFIQPDELPRFFESLSQEENAIARDYIYLSLYTGARQSNVLAMKWEQIDFESKKWRIPKTKNGDPQTIPLMKESMEILNKRREDNKKLDLPDSQKQWVLPSFKSRVGHLTEPKKAWARILQKAQIKNLRMHDIRRTLGSYQAISGASNNIIGKTLGQKSQSTTAIYARMNLDPVQESMEKAVGLMNNYKNP
ncbi:MAG: integrase [Rickettsiales bacterium]|jgi:integrase